VLDLIISLGWGAFSLTREKAEKLVDLLIAKGDISREEAKNTIKLLVARGEKEREEFRQYFQQETKNFIQKCNFVTREEFRNLQEKVTTLEKHVGDEEEKNNQI